MSSEPDCIVDCIIATCPRCCGLAIWVSCSIDAVLQQREAAYAKRLGLAVRYARTDDVRQMPRCRCAQAQPVLPGTGEAT